MKSRTFFLGAGFSKALNPAYPTLVELSASVIASFLARYSEGPVRALFDRLPVGLQQDIEQLLTYLYSDWPWKSSVDGDLDKALYKALVYEVAEALRKIEPVPISWYLRMLIHFMRMESSNKIVSLNYDALIEEYRLSDRSFCTLLKGLDIEVEEPYIADRKTSAQTPWVVGEPKKIYASDSKKKLLIAAREWINQVSIDEFRDVIATTSLKPQDSRDESLFNYTFALQSFRKVADYYPTQRTGFSGEGDGNTGKTLHLHGSLHWQDTSEPTIRLINSNGHSSLERLPAIVPPVLDKSQHYAAGRLRMIWDNAHAAIQQAKEVIIIGYLFPPTDVSCQFLFKSAVTPGTRIVVVNRDPSIKDRCDSIFGNISGIELDYKFANGADALQRYIAQEILNNSWGAVTDPLPL